MNVLVVLLLMMGGFLIMDAVGQLRVARATKEIKQTVKYVPLSIYDEQLSGRSLRDDFANMFYSSGPWNFRDDISAIGPGKDDDRDAMALAFTELQRNRADLTSSPEAIAAERRRVEERILAQFDKLAEERLKRSKIAAGDVKDNSAYAPIPKDPGERLRARKKRREALTRNAGAFSASNGSGREGPNDHPQ